MDIIIHINKYVFWFAAGWAASIICKILWRKFLIPAYVWLVDKIDDIEKNERITHKSKKYNRKEVEGDEFEKSPFDEYDKWEEKTVQVPEDYPVARMKKK